LNFEFFDFLGGKFDQGKFGDQFGFYLIKTAVSVFRRFDKKD